MKITPLAEVGSEAKAAGPYSDTLSDSESDDESQKDAICFEVGGGEAIERVIRRARPSNVRGKLFYRLDSFCMRRANQCVGLCGAFALSIVVCGVLIFLASTDGSSVAEGMWNAWTYMADPGTHADVGLQAADDEAASCATTARPMVARGDNGSALLEAGEERNTTAAPRDAGQNIIDQGRLWLVRIFAFVTTWVGILFFAVLVGIVVDFIREKMDMLKKGRSTVVERNHTLLLGWTDKSSGVIKEIALANESVKGGVVVILAPDLKERVEADIREQLKPGDLNVNGSRTKVVVRQGSPLYVNDLNKVSASEARAIILMSETGAEADKADAQSLRVILTLRGLKQGLSGHVTCEVRDIDNEALLDIVGGDMLETVVSHDIMGRLILMSARQPGLAKVFNTTLGFDGDEFYTMPWAAIDGVQFGDLYNRFPAAICIGVRTKSGAVVLNPPTGRQMKPGEGLIVIAEDDDTYAPQSPTKVDAGTLPTAQPHRPRREKILFCGWRRDVRDILTLLNSLVRPGTEVHFMAELSEARRQQLLAAEGLQLEALNNITIVHHVGNTALRRHLMDLPLVEFSSVLIMSDESREIDMMHSDSQTLATLVLIRDIQEEKGRGRIERALSNSSTASSTQRAQEWSRTGEVGARCPCVCEILDSRTQQTIAASQSVTLKSDFVESNKLISRILAMVAEDRSVRVILLELLGAHGASFAVKHSAEVCRRGEKLNFFQVAKRCQGRNLILCGYQLRNSIEETVMNPRDKLRPMVWDDFDIVVMTGRSRRATKINRVLSVKSARQLISRTPRRQTRASSFRLTGDASPLLGPASPSSSRLAGDASPLPGPSSPGEPGASPGSGPGFFLAPMKLPVDKIRALPDGTDGDARHLDSIRSMLGGLSKAQLVSLAHECLARHHAAGS